MCLLAFKGRRRDVMHPGRYTELFFLDEATALAAGHRPCFECRRPAALAFARAITGRRPGEVTRASEVDDALHPHRLPPGAGRPTWRAQASDLPDGVVVRHDGVVRLLLAGTLRTWTPTGYGPPAPVPPGALEVLTPQPTVGALTRGYAVSVHPSA